MRRFAYTILIHPCDPDEVGYWVEVPSLPGCVTQGDTLEEAVEMARDAIQCWLMGLQQTGDPIPPSDPHPQVVLDSRIEVELAA